MNKDSTKVIAIYYNIETNTQEKVYKDKNTNKYNSLTKEWSSDLELKQDTMIILLDDILDRYQQQ